jgi:DNA-binding NarL/FixJ family response regulator
MDVSRRHGQVHITPYLLIGRCLAFTRRGQIGPALESAADAEEAARLIGSHTMQAMAMAIRATAVLWRDGPDAALRVAEAAVRRNDRPRHDWWASVARRILARCQIAAGNPAAARHTLLGTGTEIDLADVEACAHPMWLAALAEIDTALGDRATAAQWLARAEEAARRTGLRGQHAYVSAAAARLALADGQAPQALASASSAVAGFDQVDQPLDAAAARLTLAGVLARSGRWEEATFHLSEAKAAAERGGASWFLQQVAGMQRQIGSAAGRAERAEPPAGPARPGELTAREWEIARLVGDGLSNVQIALRLHVTTKTVEAHLTRMYRKLGVRSRSGLAGAVAGPQPLTRSPDTQP